MCFKRTAKKRNRHKEKYKIVLLTLDLKQILIK
jgi:hypothetical protein